MRSRWRRAFAKMADMVRTGEIDRKTAETDVHVTLTLDGQGAGERRTGVGFLDHMLDLLARHGALDLVVRATGDLETGAHHTVEDVGICIGQARADRRAGADVRRTVRRARDRCEVP